MPLCRRPTEQTQGQKLVPFQGVFETQELGCKDSTGLEGWPSQASRYLVGDGISSIFSSV